MNRYIVLTNERALVPLFAPASSYPSSRSSSLFHIRQTLFSFLLSFSSLLFSPVRDSSFCFIYSEVPAARPARRAQPGTSLDLASPLVLCIWPLDAFSAARSTCFASSYCFLYDKWPTGFFSSVLARESWIEARPGRADPLSLPLSAATLAHCKTATPRDSVRGLADSSLGDSETRQRRE